VGIVIAIIALKLIKKLTHVSLSFVLMVLAALLSFVLAEQLDGLGVVAVIAFGLFIANTAVREKRHLLVFEHEVGVVVTVVALLLLGASMPWSYALLSSSLPVLGVYLAARLVAVLPFKLGFRGTIHALFAPHDVATAIVIFALAGTTVAPAFVVLLATQLLGAVDKSLNRYGF
jgi:NhaP-type Na+/H+ or K+/H+ antiporter